MILAELINLDATSNGFWRTDFTINRIRPYNLRFSVSGVDFKKGSPAKALAELCFNEDKLVTSLDNDGDYSVAIYPKHFKTHTLGIQEISIKAGLEIFDTNADGLADGINLDEIVISNLRLDDE